jgi:hypothetical protein
LLVFSQNIESRGKKKRQHESRRETIREEEWNWGGGVREGNRGECDQSMFHIRMYEMSEW